MVQRSRIAPASEMRSFRNGPKRSRSPSAWIKQLAPLAILAATLFFMPKLFDPGFLHERAAEFLASVTATGDWVRTALMAAFQSIPVWW